jgi:group I intron endonuclease
MNTITNKAGVYRILNLLDGKCYIGSSKHVCTRLREHERKLERGIHRNTYLQNAYNKYGHVFLFYIIEFYEEEIIRTKEQEYMDRYQSYDRKFGYNLDKLASNASLKMSDETKEKMRARAKARPDNRERAKKMQQFNIGRERPEHAEIMRDRWEETSKYLGYKLLTEEQKLVVRQKISKINIERYKDDSNVQGNTRISVVINAKLLSFRSLRKAAEYFKVDKGGITHALKHCNGYMKKLDITFKVVGEK